MQRHIAVILVIFLVAANLFAGFKIVESLSSPAAYEPNLDLGTPPDVNEIKVRDIVLEYGKKKWKIRAEDLKPWLSFKDPSASYVTHDSPNPLPKNPELSRLKYAVKSPDAVRFLNKINESVGVKPTDARLKVKKGRVSVFKLSRDGLGVDIPRNLVLIEDAVNSGESTVSLAMRKVAARVREDNMERLGIKERITKGVSTYYGSPNNRRHNILVGAKRFHGILIKPGATFSFNEHLGEVDKSTGYLPELVILENSTEPQYGGGLCQVSTTMFRAALNAGFPILERKRHSFPVRYYSPFGTDATIYPPHPDLKFKNTTGAYVLIQMRQENSKLTFEFYGTKPKNKVNFSGHENGKQVSIIEYVSPRIWGYGERGAGSLNAEFWRFVYNSKGKLVKKERFVSLYDSPNKYPKQFSN